MSSLGPVLGLAWAEAIRLSRTRVALGLLLVVPLMQVILFGYAIRPTEGHLTISVAAPTAESAKKAASELARMPDVHVIANAIPGRAERDVRAGKARLGIELPKQRSFADPFAKRGPVRLIADAKEPALVDAAIARLETFYWHSIVVSADVEGNGPGLRVERLYNPEGRADWAFLPALMGVTTMIAMVMLGSLQLARERETGSWEATAMLPLTPLQLLLARMIPYVAIGTIQGMGVLLLARLVFAVPLTGSVTALVLLLIPFVAAHYVLGLAIASRAATQIAALQGAVAFYLPAMLLSGFLYPFDTLPPWAQAVGNLFPLSHFIRAARGATLGGDSFAVTLAHGGPILVFGAAAAALFVFSAGKKLD